MISGFYMSLIFIGKYSKLENGTILFYTNRALRLYPTYIAILILAAVFDQITGRSVFNVFLNGKYWDFPGVLVLLSNISLIGLDAMVLADPSASHLAIGPAWTLSCEVLFYMMVPFIILNRPFVVATLFFASIMLRIYFDVNDFPKDWNYFLFHSNIVFFLLGNVGYLIYDKAKDYKISKVLGVGVIIFFFAYLSYKTFVYGSFFLAFLDPGVHSIQGILFYSSLTLALPFLFLITKDCSIDRFIGNMSYSVYLLGTPCIRNASYFFKDYDTYWVAVVLSVAVALCIYFLIERPIEAIRIKRANSARACIS